MGQLGQNRVVDRVEERELNHAVCRMEPVGFGRSVFCFDLRGLFRVVVVFQFQQNLVGAVDNRRRDAGEFGDVNSVALVRRAGNDLVQKRDVAVVFPNRDVEVGDAVAVVAQVGQFVIMRREQGSGVNGLMQMLDDRPGERNPVVGAGASADFV